MEKNPRILLSFLSVPLQSPPHHLSVFLSVFFTNFGRNPNFKLRHELAVQLIQNFWLRYVNTLVLLDHPGTRLVSLVRSQDQVIRFQKQGTGPLGPNPIS